MHGANVSTDKSKTGAIWRWLPANSTFLAKLTPAADDTQVTYGGDFSEET